jgi:hypothetical protein
MANDYHIVLILSKKTDLPTLTIPLKNEIW